MRYMLLIYTREDVIARSSQEEMLQLMTDHLSVMQAGRAEGVLEAAEPLANTSTATTVRMQNSNAIITDGPFAETKEQLAGYYILDCKDLDEAIAWASRIPTGCGGMQGCVEIRPLRAVPTNAEELQLVKSSAARNG